MLALWVGLVVLWTVGLLLLARWMRRRQAEVPPHESTLTDEQKAATQLAIANTAANTMTGR